MTKVKCIPSRAIGLIGGTASGKSEAARCFQALGVEVIDTDQIARDLVASGMPLLAKLVDYFGADIMLKSGELNRSALRAVIFKNAAAKSWLETTLHPAIRLGAEARVQSAKSPYCIVAIPLLKDRQDYPFLQKIIMLDVSPELQLQRLQKRDHIDLELAQKMLSQQPSRTERLAIADYIIVNNQDIDSLNKKIKQVGQLILDGLF